MVSHFVVLKVGGWGKTSLERGLREHIRLNTKHFPSARPNQTTSDFDWKGEFWPRVSVYKAVAFFGKRGWRQITPGNRNHIKSYFQREGLYFLLQVLEELRMATCFITNFFTTLKNDREIYVPPLKVRGMLTTLLLCTSNAASELSENMVLVPRDQSAGQFWSCQCVQQAVCKRAALRTVLSDTCLVAACL